MTKKRMFHIFIYVTAITAVIVFLFPIYWILITSFKSYKEAFATPPHFFVLPDFENYKKYLANNEILKCLINSVIIAGVSTFLALMTGLMAAYSLSRTKLRGGTAITLFMIGSRFVPTVSTLIPLYFVYRKFGIYDTKLGLIIIELATGIPYVVMMMRGFLDGVSTEVEESAWLDGCGRFKGIWLIVVPMCKGGLAATAVLTFITAWNDFLNPMILAGSKAKTLPLTMTTYMSDIGIEWNMMATAGIVIMLPTVFFAIMTNKNLGAGMTMGAIKG